MQITEKLRNEIALSLPSLGKQDVKRIATECECSTDTVYREWRKIKGTEKPLPDMENPVVLALAELAVKRRQENKTKALRAEKIMKQLSAA